MKVTYRFNVPTINLSGYRTALDKHMREVIGQAVMEWLDVVLAEVPLWSGASRATFHKLQQAVGHSYSYGFSGERGRMGEEMSTGEIETRADKGTYTFTYGTTLPHLIWNEYHNANVDPDATKWPPPAELHKPGPYGFQRIGEYAFKKFAESVKLPAVAPFVKASPVRK